MSCRSGWDLRSRNLIGVSLVVAGLLGAPGAGEARVYLSKSEALEVAFPDAERVESETFILDEEQARAVESLARAPLDDRVITVHRGVAGGEPTAWALIDVHTVRTLPEAFLIVISPEGEVRSLRLLAFYEPPEYAPHRRWLSQFDDEALSDDLRLGRRIHAIGGSTLSSRAVTSAVRRALALWQVLIVGGAGAEPTVGSGADAAADSGAGTGPAAGAGGRAGAAGGAGR